MRVLLFFLALSTSPAGAEPVPFGGETVTLRALPAATDPRPLDTHMRYVGGYEIAAHGTSLVYGLSDLELTPAAGGLKVEAISDRGAAVTFSLRQTEKGGLAESPVTIDLLRQEDGHAYNDLNRNDAEDMAVDPVTGTRYVSFERLQRVMAYSGWTGTGRKLALGGLPSFPGNAGMEGLAFLPEAEGGSLLIGVESGGFWLCPLKTLACAEVTGPSPPGFLYMLSSLTTVPGRPGEILALYRYFDPFSGPRNILSRLKLDGTKLTRIGDLAKIAPPLPFDNYEGVAVVPDGTGYRLYLISDSLHDDDKPRLLVYDWTP